LKSNIYFFLLALDWKERKILRLSSKGEKKKAKKAQDQGYFEDIEHLFDESRGDKMYEISESSPDMVFSTGEDLDEKEEDKMIVSIPSLFGSSKSYGLIERKENKDKLKFSHSRVFGYAPRLTRASYGGIERKRQEKAAEVAKQ
jgi:hypothetical protein